MASTVDINGVLADGSSVIVRRPESPEDAAHRRWRTTIFFGVSLLVVVAVVLGSAWALFFGHISDKAADVAGHLLTALIGALAGFLIGKSPAGSD